MSKFFIFFVALVAISMVDAKHIYARYKRSIERENDVPSQESTVVVQGDDADQVHKSVKDFSNEIETNEKGGKDFVEFDYNPQQDLFKFSGNFPKMFSNPHLQLFEQMMQQMLKQTQQMFQNFPVTTINNYPENYNGTTESEVIIGGRRFRKKERVINKSTNDTQLHIISTVYEPIEDDEVGVTTTTPNKDGVTEAKTKVDPYQQQLRYKSIYKPNSWSLFDNINRFLWMLPFSMALYTGYKHYLDFCEYKSTILTLEDLDRMPPVELPKDPEKIKELAGKRKVKLKGKFDHDNEFLLAQRINQQITENLIMSQFDKSAYYVLTPMILEDGRRVLVNRGWVSKFRKDPEQRTLGQVEGIIELNAYVQTEENLDLFSQIRTIAFSKFYWYRSENTDNQFNMETLSKKLNVDPVALFVADLESTQKMGPIGGQINPNNFDVNLKECKDTIIYLMVALIFYQL